MNVIVIGGTGFVGEYLCRLFIDRGHRVTAVYASELSPEEKIDGVRYKKIDLNVDFLDLKNILGEIDAAVFSIQPDILRMKNIISVVSLFDNIKKIVYLSSLLIYPDSVSKQSENVIPKPESDYERAKYGEELLLTKFAKGTGRSLLIARLGNVYGDIKNKGVVDKIMLSLIRSQEFRLDGDGLNLRDYVFVEDVARMVVGLADLQTGSRAEVFNVCTGVGSSVLDVVGLLEKIVSRKLKLLKSDKITKQKNVVGDNQKAAKILNFCPQYGLTEGLKRAYNNYSKFYQVI